MKYQTTTKGLIAGLALSAFFGFAISAQAQTCTIANWDDSNGLANANAGTQGSGNRRYGGPCGLRVPVDGVPRYLVDDSPATESTYIARFYAFLNNAGSEEVILFEDGGSNLQVWYNVPDPGDITLNVVDSASEANFLTVSGAGAGWHSIEFSWESSATANIAFSVNGGPDLTDTIDTSGITLSSVRLGNVNGVSGPGTIDFDDFDSRRISRPGRLLVGDANGDGNINFFDLFELNNEIAGGGFFAAGQPDCNEDGEINFFDLFCLNNQL